jgi:hypothetical protein
MTFSPTSHAILSATSIAKDAWPKFIKGTAKLLFTILNRSNPRDRRDGGPVASGISVAPP